MPKCLSKFEQEISDFHSDFNNVFTFGGLEPGGVGAQMNISALGKVLSFFIGRVQGVGIAMCLTISAHGHCSHSCYELVQVISISYFCGNLFRL